LNLHVARKFKPEDGFPATVNDIPFDFDKRVDYFEPRMVELQKEYARALLTHVNPFTGNAYARNRLSCAWKSTTRMRLCGSIRALV
jgi:hypothetical protein